MAAGVTAVTRRTAAPAQPRNPGAIPSPPVTAVILTCAGQRVDIVTAFREAGGFSSIAHPDTLSDKSVIEQWAKRGLDALEVYYSTHTPSDIVRYSDMAERLGLIATGGTDFHGPGSGRDKALGVNVPEKVYDAFMERLAKCG